ncbi:MAG: hypothetical protein AVDCRST_MAG15-1018 [uncultured Rubellimicrobium sp.]|uniref:Uncharacterized protein n=1 Tax=uncultured Rubellimicrobium sp. TaxID=543078 RepID=A0A6J4NCE6_9RHOB|nr:MAG: hypothetical protein AVDCRST_MAG15-1018 [uncultured Rubellimicrobium sp.]
MPGREADELNQTFGRKSREDTTFANAGLTGRLGIGSSSWEPRSFS